MDTTSQYEHTLHPILLDSVSRTLGDEEERGSELDTE